MQKSWQTVDDDLIAAGYEPFVPSGMPNDSKPSPSSSASVRRLPVSTINQKPAEPTLMDRLIELNDVTWNVDDLYRGISTPLRRRSAAISERTAVFLVRNADRMAQLEDLPFLTTDLHDEAVRIVSAAASKPVVDPFRWTQERSDRFDDECRKNRLTNLEIQLEYSRQRDAERSVFSRSSSSSSSSIRSADVADKKHAGGIRPLKTVDPTSQNGLQLLENLGRLAYWKRYGKAMNVEGLTDDFDQFYRVGDVTVPICQACRSSSTADFEAWMRSNALSSVPILNGRPSLSEPKNRPRSVAAAVRGLEDDCRHPYGWPGSYWISVLADLLQRIPADSDAMAVLRAAAFVHPILMSPSSSKKL